jgi:hypothetical protein
MRILLTLAVLLAASGCVSKLAYPRVKSAMLDAGLSDANAGCMASRMTDRLTIGQLRKLEALSGDKRSLMDYVSAVRRVGDTEALAVTASSAALCTSGLAR